uniref:Uncharacterized protein n=2 Tax=Lutzomyia longipalpis TaxID=7200 RepID=A0A1B0CQ87_LUTLO
MEKKSLIGNVFLPQNYMDSVCRICLEMNTGLVSVFSTLMLETSDDGEGVKISDLAAYTLNLFIHPEDKLPKNVCQRCVSSIVDFRSFKVKAQEAERNFICSLEALEKREKITEEEDGEEEDKNELPEVKDEDTDREEENVDDQESSEFFCSSCSKCFQSQVQLESHMKYHESTHLVSTYVKFFPCHSCHTIFLTDSGLSKHFQSFPDHVNASSRSQDDDVFDPCAYTCGICSESNSHVDELKMHVFQHSEKFICPIRECGWEYGTFARLSYHMRRKHVSRMQHKCEYCPATFDDYTVFRRHVRFQCTERKFKCTHCDKAFFNRKALQFHLKCTNDKNFICEVCGKGFGYRGDLTIHMRTHTNERPFKCKICSKTYKTASMRIAHMDVHIQGKTYPCDICGLRLQSRASFRGHLRRHKEFNQHGCDICGKLFNSKYRLKVHKIGYHKIMPSA